MGAFHYICNFFLQPTDPLLNGEQELVLKTANRITKKATSRGTDFHAATELYMLNKEIDWDEFRPLTKFMFHHAKPYLDKINNIHAIERTLYSEYPWFSRQS